MSSERATNLTVTLFQPVQHVSNFVAQLNSNTIKSIRFSDQSFQFLVFCGYIKKCNLAHKAWKLTSHYKITKCAMVIWDAC